MFYPTVHKTGYIRFSDTDRLFINTIIEYTEIFINTIIELSLIIVTHKNEWKNTKEQRTWNSSILEYGHESLVEIKHEEAFLIILIV